MRLAYCSQHLTARDGVAILGAVQFFLQHRDICRTMRDYSGNCLAQGTVVSLRCELYESAYGKGCQ